MGFWYYYVLPLVTAILFVWLGNRVMVTKKWISIIFYSLAGVGYLIASVFAVFLYLCNSRRNFNARYFNKNRLALFLE